MARRTDVTVKRHVEWLTDENVRRHGIKGKYADTLAVYK